MARATARDIAMQGQPAVLRLAHGYDHLAAADAVAALETADAVLADAPTLAEAYVLRGAALKAMGRFAEAIAAWQAALAHGPARPAVLASLGNAHAELGDDDAAAAALRRALALAPGLAAAQASLVSVVARRQDDDATEALCREMLASDAGCVNAHLHLADVLARRGQTAEAQAHRHTAYRRQNVFVVPATRPGAPTALVLLTAEDGNIPLRYLLSRDRYTVIKWLIDHATPNQYSRLPPHDFILNAVGEPELPAATQAAAEFVRQRAAVAFLNRPDRVARTGRPALPALLAGLQGVVVPKVARWRAGDPPPALGWPALVRPLGAHGGAGLLRVADAASLAEVAAGRAQNDVTAFVGFASADRLYRKYRAIFIDRKPYPYHLAIGDDWLVHYISANMLGHAARRAEEARFLADPAAAIGAAAWAALSAIAVRLDLDYAGIDFSILPDGCVLVFEANATMVVHPETPGGVLDFKNPAVARILAAFDAMAAERSRPGATSNGAHASASHRR